MQNSLNTELLYTTVLCSWCDWRACRCLNSLTHLEVVESICLLLVDMRSPIFEINLNATGGYCKGFVGGYGIRKYSYSSNMLNEVA
jgi:uncharacterized cysteine cluster protein YcgN (CxxCxxCC family)